MRQVDDGTEVALRCSFYRVAAAVLPPCHRPMSVAAAMLLRGGTAHCQRSVRISEYNGLEFLEYSLLVQLWH